MKMTNLTFFGMDQFDPNNGMRNRYDDITITVTEQTLSIPTNTFKAIGNPEQVEIFFNDSKKFFGIRGVDGQTKFSVPCSVSNNSVSVNRTVICKKIDSLRNFDRKQNNLILRSGQFDDESKCWIFDLDAGEIIKRGKRG